MITVIVGIGGLAVGFVVGVLFGRKNVKTVEADVAAVKAEISKLTGGKVNV